jgi:hypothetical protein
VFSIEFEVPSNVTVKSMTPVKTDLQSDILTTVFQEVPIIRISRSYAELVALDTALDMSISVLGAKLPDDFVDGSEDFLEDPDDITRVIEGVDQWLKAVILKVNASEVPSFGDFLKPNDEDVASMLSDLTASGGLDQSWADIMNAFP